MSLISVLVIIGAAKTASECPLPVSNHDLISCRAKVEAAHLRIDFQRNEKTIIIIVKSWKLQVVFTWNPYDYNQILQIIKTIKALMISILIKRFQAERKFFRVTMIKIMV